MAKTSSVSPQTLVISRLMSATTVVVRERQVPGEIVRAEDELLLGGHGDEAEVGLELLRPLGVIAGQGEESGRGGAVVHGPVVDLVALERLVLAEMVVVGREDDRPLPGGRVLGPDDAGDVDAVDGAEDPVLADLGPQSERDGREIRALGPGPEGLDGRA